MDWRSERLILQTSKNAHRSVCVSNLVLAKTFIRGIDRVRRFVSRNHGHLIVESLRSTEVALREIWKNVLLNIIDVQRDYDPIDSTVSSALVIGGGRHIVRDRTNESWDARFKLPAR